MRDPLTPPPDYLDHAAARRIVVGVLLTMLLAALDQVMVATALPTIAVSLGDIDNMSWVVTANLLCATAATPLYGKLSDVYGRRTMILIAIGIYAAGSLACALAPSMGNGKVIGHDPDPWIRNEIPRHYDSAWPD